MTIKLISFFIICILALPASGQEKEVKEKTGSVSVQSERNEQDSFDVNSPLKVIYLDTDQSAKQPAYFIDGIFFSETTLKTINPQLIDSIFVDKEETTIEGKNYYGQVHFKMKDAYNPEFISLTDLKTKYLKQSKNPSMCIIDNDIINSDYNKFLVDKNYILKIEVQEVVNEEEDLTIDVIRLITKTKENIERANEIRIR